MEEAKNGQLEAKKRAAECEREIATLQKRQREFGSELDTCKAALDVCANPSRSCPQTALGRTLSLICGLKMRARFGCRVPGHS